MSLVSFVNTPAALLRCCAPAALAGCRLLSTSTAVSQQAKTAERSGDDADHFAKTPLRARVLSEEARQVADLLRRNDFGSLRRRTAQTFGANGGLPAALQGGQSGRAAFAHNNHVATSVVGGQDTNITNAA
ncbi:hypothetical protein ABPG77_001235 [Micractinium sp. CCAP 211/92]